MPTDCPAACPARVTVAFCFLIASCFVSQARAAAPSGGTHASLAGVAHMSRQVLQQTDAGGGNIRLRLSLGNSRVELTLQPYSMRAANCGAVAEGPGGVQTKLELPPITTYRGTVDGDAKGIVAASIEGGAVRARLLMDDGSDWYVQPLSGTDVGAHAVYRSEDVTDSPGTCATDGDASPAQVQPNLSPVSPGAPVAPLAPQALESQSSGCLEAEIAFEADYAYYQWNGSSTNTTMSDIDAVMNAVSLIYARDAKIDYKITNYLIQTSNTNKYPTTDPNTMLTDFQNWWNANETSVTRDLAHLMTGIDMSGLIGISKIAVVCTTSQAYGVSHSPGTVWANRVGLTAHEIGHNWAATHCDNTDTCWIMCSHIAGCAADPSRFSLRSIQEISTYRDLSGSCLAAGSGTTTPLNPTARDDQTVTTPGANVTINVLSNDFDPNCQAISIASFPTSTATGATISASGDALVYHPAAGFTGNDNFTYTVQDAGGARSTAKAAVTVENYQAAQPLVGALPGLQVRYYSVPPLDGSLGSMPALNNPFNVETLPGIWFPQSSGAFGESGLKKKVAARCTGTLNLPSTNTYTFYLTSCDGSILYVDNVQKLSNDGIHSMTMKSVALSLTSGPHTIRVDYYNASGSAGLLLELSSSTITRAMIPSSMWSLPGVQVSYYQLDSTILPPLAAMAPERTESVTQINYPFSWGSFAGSGRTVDVGAVYEGLLTVPTDNVYFFDLTSQSGSRLYVGDKLVVDNDGDHNRISLTGGVALRAGPHPFRVEYFERGGGNALTLSVSSSALSKQVVPATWFSHLATVHVPLDYSSISSAISAAAVNGMVWVAAGTYTGSSNTNLNFGGKAITLKGGGGPDLTIIDCQSTSRAFNFVNHAAATAVIDGFSIWHGAAPSGSTGGAMFFNNSSLQVQNCYIEGNTSPANGGGVGMVTGSMPTFTDCVISGNRASSSGGGVDVESASHPTFNGCTVSGNLAATAGGGVYATTGGWATLQTSILWGNTSPGQGAEAWTADATSKVDFACSDVLQTGVGGTGNETFGSNVFESDPEFCVPASGAQAPTTTGGYRVGDTSLVLEGQNACGTQIGALGQGCGQAVTGVEVEATPKAPSAVVLEQNMPNPFNPDTRIGFTLEDAGRASLRVFDAAGRLVATLVDQNLPAGRHEYVWGGRNSRNQAAASGVYFYQLRTGGSVMTRNMVLLK